MRQHGRKVLGAPLSTASVARIQEKFALLNDTASEAKSASGWGRVGKAVVACLDLSEALEVVVTTKTNHEVKITVTGFSFPVGTTALAETLNKESENVLPPHRRLSKEEFEYYYQKAIAMDKLPQQFQLPSLLREFATAADFPGIVTDFSPVEKPVKIKETTTPHEPGNDDLAKSRSWTKGPVGGDQIGHPGFPTQSPLNLPRAPSNNDAISGRKILMPIPQVPVSNSAEYYGVSAQSFVGPPNTFTDRVNAFSRPHAMNSPSEGRKILTPFSQYPAFGRPELHEPTNLTEHTQAVLRFGTTNPSRYDKSQKRSLGGPPLGDAPAAKKHNLSSGFQASTASPTSVPALPPLAPFNSTTNNGIPAPAHKKPKIVKPIPTREEVHAAWIGEVMTQYTVPQLRGYLGQEGMFSGLNNTSTRNVLMLRVQQMEMGEVEFGEED